MKNFSNIFDADIYFCKMFSKGAGLFGSLKYRETTLGLALQHNVYEYYKSFIFSSDIKKSLKQSVVSKTRIMGFDHQIKFRMNCLLGTRQRRPRPGSILFFADNFVPRILDDFRKVITEMNQENVYFCTTDYRAYRYMLKNAGLQSQNVVLIGGFGKNGSKPYKLDMLRQFRHLEPELGREFGTQAKIISRIVRANLVMLSRYYDLFDDFLADARPSRIVLGSDGFSVARVMCFAAAKQGVSTHVLQHGLIDSLNGYLPLFADSIFVWTDYEKKLFVKNGVSPHQLIVSGSPRFERSNYSQPVEHSGTRRRLLFVICPGIPEDIYSQMNEAIKAAEYLQSDYDIYIRPHPYYKIPSGTYFKQVKRDNTFLDEDSFLHSMQQADIIVFGDISTGVFEALNQNKPVFILANDSKSKVEIYEFPNIGMEKLLAVLKDDRLRLADEYNLSKTGSGAGVADLSVGSSVTVCSYLESA